MFYFLKKDICSFDIQSSFNAHKPYNSVAKQNAIPLYKSAKNLESVTGMVVDTSYKPNPKIQDTQMTAKNLPI